MPRPTPQPLSGSTSLRPVAAPTDATPRPNGQMTELIRALSEINPELARFGQIEADKTHHEAYRASLVSKAETLQEAISNGEVSFGASEVAQKAWQAGKGRNFGDSYFGDMWEEFGRSELAGSGDAGGVARWLQERRSAALKDKSQDFVDSALPRIQGAEQQVQQQAASAFHQRVEQETKSDLGQWMMQQAIDGFATGQTPAAIVKTLREGTTTARFAGLSGKDINRIEVAALIATAEQTGDTRYLDLAALDRPDIKDQTKMIKGPGSVPEFATDLEAARVRVESRQYMTENRAALLHEKQEKDGFREAMRAVVNDAIINRGTPNYRTPPELITGGQSFDPEFAIKAQQAVNVFLSAEQREDAIGTFKAREHIRKARELGEDPYEALSEAIADGLIRDPISAEKLYNDIENTDDRDNPTSVFRMSEVKAVEDRLIRTLGETGDKAVLPFLEGGQRTKVINDAALSFRNEMALFQASFSRQNNRPPTALEAQARANEVTRRVLGEAQEVTGAVDLPLRKTIKPDSLPTNPVIRNNQPVPGTNVYKPMMHTYGVPTVDARGRPVMITRSFPALPTLQIVDMLRKDHQKIAPRFDTAYGAGASAFFLGMNGQQVREYLATHQLPAGAKPQN